MKVPELFRLIEGQWTNDEGHIISVKNKTAVYCDCNGTKVHETVFVRKGKTIADGLDWALDVRKASKDRIVLQKGTELAIWVRKIDEKQSDLEVSDQNSNAKQPARSRKKRKPKGTKTGFVCQICLKKFKKSKVLDSHKKKAHSDKRPYECHLCSKAYTKNSNLIHHIHQIHGAHRIHQIHGSKPDKCNVCQTKFDPKVVRKHKKKERKEKLKTQTSKRKSGEMSVEEEDGKTTNDAQDPSAVRRAKTGSTSKAVKRIRKSSRKSNSSKLVKSRAAPNSAKSSGIANSATSTATAPSVTAPSPPREDPAVTNSAAPDTTSQRPTATSKYPNTRARTSRKRSRWPLRSQHNNPAEAVTTVPEPQLSSQVPSESAPLLQVATIKLFRCKTCRKIFSNKAEFTSHQERHGQSASDAIVIEDSCDSTSTSVTSKRRTNDNLAPKSAFFPNPRNSDQPSESKNDDTTEEATRDVIIIEDDDDPHPTYVSSKGKENGSLESKTKKMSGQKHESLEPKTKKRMPVFNTQGSAQSNEPENDKTIKEANREIIVIDDTCDTHSIKNANQQSKDGTASISPIGRKNANLLPNYTSSSSSSGRKNATWPPKEKSSKSVFNTPNISQSSRYKKHKRNDPIIKIEVGTRKAKHPSPVPDPENVAEIAEPTFVPCNIEKLLKTKTKNGKKYFLVKWGECSVPGPSTSWLAEENVLQWKQSK